MRIILLLTFLLLALSLSACSSANPARNDRSATSAKPSAPTAPGGTRTDQDGTAAKTSGSPAPADQTNTAQTNAAAAERKIIKNANLELEVAQPEAAQAQIASIADAKGGFIVSTSAQRQEAEGQSGAGMTITVVARVPAAQYDASVSEIRKLATRVQKETQTGQDVTEDYVDLEARLKAKQALEVQYLEIMKRANTVNEALEVQRALADVRTEIEQLQGKMRYLQNQASFSTITVTLSQPTPFLGTTSGFWASLKNAFNDGLWVATAILLFLVRAGLALIPIIVLIFLPIGLLWWYLWRRWRRAWVARRLAKQEMERTLEADKHREP